jgi:MFS family permease
MQTQKKEQRRVILASSLGTVFEWYDFYLYATLAPFFAALFFPKGNETAALLSAFATYAAGFLVRPFGAIVFGRIGDLVGRKYTFLVTIVVMGASTAAVGFLPTYESIGFAAPLLLVALRLAQGLALGGEYGGAATYVAEHARDSERGYATSWIQTTATAGFFLSLLVIGLCRTSMSADAFSTWGWRIPFLVSIVLLAYSIYLRLKLKESPVFAAMKAQGRSSKSPLTDSFLRYPNNKYVLLALFGATAGQGVVWYTGQFYALFFLTITLKVDYLTAYMLIGAALLIGTPFFIVFGKLSDRIGRLKIILAGCALAAMTYVPIFKALTQTVNPALAQYQLTTPITVAASDCSFHIFVLPGTTFTDCDRAKDFLTKSGLSFESLPAEAQDRVVTTIGDRVSRRGGQVAHRLCRDARAAGRAHALRDDGLRPDRRVSRRAVPHQDPLHLDVAAVPHRQRLVRRHAALARHRNGRGIRGHLFRPVVSDRRRADDARHRRPFPARRQSPQHRGPRLTGTNVRAGVSH